MKVHITVEFDLEDEDGEEITGRRIYEDAAENFVEVVKDRVFGNGFLDYGICLHDYTIKSEVLP